MEVILLKDVAKVGKRYDIVTVADGYALHCLIPQGLAQAATPAARAMHTAQRAKESAQKGAHDAENAKNISTVDGKTVTIKEKANEQGHLFGSLHIERIVSAMYDQLGVTIPNDCITLPHPIKETGEFSLKLSSGTATGALSLHVEAEK
jgi:large subunit ribosomal protein L9